MSKRYLNEIPADDNKPKGRQWKKLVYGSNEDTRQRVYNTFPRLIQVTDSIANEYNINPKLLRTRLAQEGFIDSIGRDNDARINQGDTLLSKEAYINDILNGFYNGYENFGSDDIPLLISEGKIKPIRENYNIGDGVLNKKGRLVNPATGSTNYDNIGLTAATLQYFRNEAEKAYPKATADELDRYANIFYNRGVAGGKSYIKNGGKGYKVKYRLGGDFRMSLKNGGIYIKPSHRGRFTALKERTGHSTSWFKENGTPAQKKMATFALNATKWNH